MWKLQKTVTTAGLSDYNKAVHYLQDINNEYVKTKWNEETYKALEVIVEVINSTN